VPYTPPELVPESIIPWPTPAPRVSPPPAAPPEMAAPDEPAEPLPESLMPPTPPPAEEEPARAATALDVPLHIPTARRAPSRTPPSKNAPPPPARGGGKRDSRTGGKAPKPPPPGSIDEQVVIDAVRLLKWGREWHELAEAIARIADRPGVVEVRKMLRTHKAEIERAAAE
jgi:hypothetical protein